MRISVRTQMLQVCSVIACVGIWPVVFSGNAMAGCYDPRKVIEAMSQSDQTGNFNPVVLAHRGLWRASGSDSIDVVVPENSISSLKSADDACIEAAELDLKTTNDGVPVVMHDFNLGGMTDVEEGSTGLFSPWTNSGTNPKVSDYNSKDYSELHLRLKRSDKKLTISLNDAPTAQRMYDYYYLKKMSIAIVWDVKSVDDAIALAKIISSDTRDYSHGTSPTPVRAYEITAFKINAPVYPYGIWYVNDMMMAGVENPPKVIPVYTTNMEEVLHEKFLSSPIESLSSWSATSTGLFLAPEINLKEKDGLLSEVIAYAQNANMSVGVFNALPDWLDNSQPYAPPDNKIPWNQAFVKNTGECCYQLSDRYAEYNGKSDTADNRGSWSFLSDTHFGVVTTDQADSFIEYIGNQRNTDRYGVTTWWPDRSRAAKGRSLGY